MKTFYADKYKNDGCDESSPLVLFHISNKKLDSIKASIPRTAGRKEDHATNRICFSPSINGCISAVWPVKSVFYVYVPVLPIDQLKLMTPTIANCYDCKETKEVWCLDDEVELKCVGKIHVDVSRFIVERKHNYVSSHYDIIKHRWKIMEIDDPRYRSIIQSAFEYQDTYIKEVSL